jgi:hypothetical protein
MKKVCVISVLLAAVSIFSSCASFRALGGAFGSIGGKVTLKDKYVDPSVPVDNHARVYLSPIQVNGFGGVNLGMYALDGASELTTFTTLTVGDVVLIPPGAHTLGLTVETDKTGGSLDFPVTLEAGKFYALAGSADPALGISLMNFQKYYVGIFDGETCLQSTEKELWQKIIDNTETEVENLKNKR